MDGIILRPGAATLAQFRAIWSGAPARLHDDGWKALEASAGSVAEGLAAGRTIYGVNTGFGLLAKNKIAADQLEALQRNLILSHCCGVGGALDRRTVRLIMALKAIGLARGHSGIRPVLVERLLALLEADALPVVPAQGSVGASGDLAPLAHLSAPLIGEGHILLDGETLPAATALQRLGLEPLVLGPKEGLALINGTQVSTAIALEALFIAERVLSASLIAAAMSVDALHGYDVPFDPRIHEVRGQPGQIAVAAMVARLRQGSAIHAAQRDDDVSVQDPYSFRCLPQVAGACLDLLRNTARTLEIDANAVTDNPIMFGGQELSGGNFHAQPVAFAADILAMALCEIGSLSERRTAILIDPAHNRKLPAFLVEDVGGNKGVNSGFMIAHVTAAALVSENKSLAFPASVDSIPTSAGQEDHVSMATHAALKARRIADNAAGTVGIELLAAAQGIDLRRKHLASNLGANAAGGPVSSPALEKARAEIRRNVAYFASDRYLADDIAWAKAMVLAGGLTGEVQAELFEA
jgi:histidine ammonia-lyase